MSMRICVREATMTRCRSVIFCPITSPQIVSCDTRKSRGWIPTVRFSENCSRDTWNSWFTNSWKCLLTSREMTTAFGVKLLLFFFISYLTRWYHARIKSALFFKFSQKFQGPRIRTLRRANGVQIMRHPLTLVRGKAQHRSQLHRARSLNWGKKRIRKIAIPRPKLKFSRATFPR